MPDTQMLTSNCAVTLNIFLLYMIHFKHWFGESSEGTEDKVLGSRHCK